MGTDRRTTLVILYGGRSAEHDVSCVSAAHVIAAADPGRYRIVPVGISRDGQWHLDSATMGALDEAGQGFPGETALPSRLDPAGEQTTLPAVIAATSGETVVIPLLHGPLGEDGTVQGMLEVLDVPYVGSGVLGSSLSMDKAMAKQVLAVAGVPQVRWHTVHADETGPATLAHVADDLGYPLFVKPSNMGSSIGISKANDAAELARAVDLAARYDEWIVIEEAVRGREIEVSVLGNLQPRASVPGEITPSREFYDYEDKYVVDGATLSVPAAITPDQADSVRDLAVKVFSALRCEGMARVDFFLVEDGSGWRFYCNEVNTIPGFTPISMYPKLWQASGVSYPELIDELVMLALERHRRKRRHVER